MRRTPMTPEGYRTLKEELDNLKKNERPKIIADIEEARGHGDLTENAEYIYAKERQSFIETKIQELEQRLANAEVIDPVGLPKDKVVFGSKVLLCNVETGKEVTYQIVGVDESDINQGKISVESPIAKALIGKKLDDTVVVKTPRGEKEYEVLDIIQE
ncbi:MAG: transcription elongation factor GreA [Deltaproteobacteria bacterium]|nr:MAG: transcription elongation factor GreA [Deltaproteobacteria bacterium]